MIVWSGKGFLSVLVLFGTLILSTWALPDSLSDYGFVIACFVSGGFSWIFGKKWNKQNERIVTDNKTGQKLGIQINHTLFWIPLQYWGIIFSILGMIILFQNSISLSIVALIILVGLLIFLSHKPKSDKPIRTQSNLKFKSSKTKMKEQAEVEERLLKLAEEEAERLKRRKEKG